MHFKFTQHDVKLSGWVGNLVYTMYVVHAPIGNR